MIIIQSGLTCVTQSFLFHLLVSKLQFKLHCSISTVSLSVSSCTVELPWSHCATVALLVVVVSVCSLNVAVDTSCFCFCFVAALLEVECGRGERGRERERGVC